MRNLDIKKYGTTAKPRLSTVMSGVTSTDNRIPQIIRKKTNYYQNAFEQFKFTVSVYIFNFDTLNNYLQGRLVKN